MPRKRRKKSKVYFGTPAQEAIIEYNNCKDPAVRNEIYKTRIKYLSLIHISEPTRRS